MKHLLSVTLLSLPVLVQAQSPTITSISPAANARAAARTGPVTITFSQALTANSAAGLKIYSAQRGGLRTRANTVAMVSGNSLVFTPSPYRFLPGEMVSVTVTNTAASIGGTLAHPRVIQFTTATEGTGRGQFVPGANQSVGARPTDLVAGDVDGDGDLDIVMINRNSAPAVQVLLNGGDATGSNTGSFTLGSTAVAGSSPIGIAMGDVDGDGDLDIAVANSGSNTVSVRLNGGGATGSNTGVFSGGQTISFANSPTAVQLADMDNDGDLDLINIQVGGTITVAFNGSDNTGTNTGIFQGGTGVLAGYNPNGLATGDVDGDGDLDLITVNNNLGSSSISGTLRVSLNGGNSLGTGVGYFSNGSTVAVGNTPTDVAVGDLDGDGDLDLLAANFNSGTVSVRLNGGNATGSNTGVFSAGSDVNVGSFPLKVILGDVDADGDLDLLVSHNLGNSVTVLLNGGDATGSNTGSFSNGSTIPVGNSPIGIKLADLDGDGDLDLLATNKSDRTISVRLNGGTQVLATRAANAGRETDLVIAPTVLADGAVRYTYTGPTLTSESTMYIYSSDGRQVWKSPVGVAAGELPGASLVSGWYVLRLITTSHSYNARFYQP